MKKTLMILALAMFSFANAQKGTVLVMGSIGYTSQEINNIVNVSNSDFISFSPKLGYQIKENWTVGIESLIESSKTKYTGGDSKVNNFSMGGFLRYSRPIVSLFSFYADLGAGFNNGKQTNHVESNQSQEEYNSSIKSNGFYVGITPALLINIDRGFGLNLNFGSLKYNYLKDNSDLSREYKTFNFNFGKAFSIGLSKNF